MVDSLVFVERFCTAVEGTSKQCYVEERDDCMDHFGLPSMPPGYFPLLDSLRNSLVPGWPQFRPQGGMLLPPTTTAAAAAALPPGLSPLSIAAITGVLQTPSIPREQAGSSKMHSKEPMMNNNVKEEDGDGEDEDEDGEMDKDSDRTEPATECTTPSTVSLSSPNRFTFPTSPGESSGDGRRQSTSNLSAKSLASKKRVTCELCGKSYCDKGALKIHHSAVHLKEMQTCTVPGCTKEFTSRRSRNRHSKNRNMKLHTSDPTRLAAITAIQEQGRLLSGAMVSQSLPVRESRKRRSTEGALDLSIHSDLAAPTPLFSSPVLPTAPSMHLALLQMQQMMTSQLFAQQQLASLAAAASAASTAPSTTVSQTSPSTSSI